MLVKFFRNFRCRYSVDDLGNIFDGMAFSELEPIILEAFGRNSEEYEYLESFFYVNADPVDADLISAIRTIMENTHPHLND